MREEVSFLVHLEYGKRDQPFVSAASDDGLVSRRIFVMDRHSKIFFLVDTGADICVYLRNKIRGPANRSGSQHTVPS